MVLVPVAVLVLAVREGLVTALVLEAKTSLVCWYWLKMPLVTLKMPLWGPVTALVPEEKSTF